MKEKKANNKNKNKRLVRKPSLFLWYFIGSIFLLYFLCHIKIIKNKIKIRKGSLIIAPHRSYFDFVSIPYVTWPKRGHVVSTTYWYRNKMLGKLLDAIGVIPKDQYRPDVRAIRKINDCIKRGDIIYMFPEGQMSIDGRSLPLAPGLDKLIKRFKPNVYFVKTEGAYLSSPKWGPKFKKGTIKLTTELLIKSEDIDSMSLESINNLVEERFDSLDEFAFVRNHPDYVYKRKNKAEKIDKVISICPKCHNQYALESHGDVISCSNCDFSVELEKKSYNFKDNPYFKDLGELIDYDTKYFLDEIENGLSLEDDARVGYYVKFDEVDCGNYHIKMNKETISLTNDKEQIIFDLNKVINFVVTLGVAFEIPTPEKTYRIYPTDGRHAVKYLEFITSIKREKENKC